jgi:hypothetical protein
LKCNKDRGLRTIKREILNKKGRLFYVLPKGAKTRKTKRKIELSKCQLECFSFSEKCIENVGEGL